jgi:hypothetical protein
VDMVTLRSGRNFSSRLPIGRGTQLNIQTNN